MNTKILLPLSAGLLLALASCKKDEDKKPPSKTDLLTTGQWRIKAMTFSPPADVDGDGIPDSDLYALMDACEKDNVLLFKKDGTYEVNEGPTKCDVNDPQTQTLNWKFEEAETVLTANGTRMKIDELSDAKVVLTETDRGMSITTTLGR